MGRYKHFPGFLCLHHSHCLMTHGFCGNSFISKNLALPFVSQTALQIAAATNQHLIVHDLLEHGAQINTRDLWGRSPLHVCAEKGHLLSLQVRMNCCNQHTSISVSQGPFISQKLTEVGQVGAKMVGKKSVLQHTLTSDTQEEL